MLLREIAEEPEEQLRALLAQLQAAEFLHETALFPDLEYSFKHALTHEVTYGGLLQEHRRALHARIVEAIERLHAGSPRRADRAARPSCRSGSAGEKAVDYLRQAGLKATGRQALHEARVQFEQALDLLRSLLHDRLALEKAVDIRLELRAVLIQLDESHKIIEHLREAERIVERLNDDRQARSRLGVHGESLPAAWRTRSCADIRNSRSGNRNETRRPGASSLCCVRSRGGCISTGVTWCRAIELATEVLAAPAPGLGLAECRWQRPWPSRS